MASRSEVRIFTIQEANEAAKELRQTLPAMRRTLHEIEKLEDRLEVLDLICSRAVSSENPDLQEYIALKVRYHRKISEFEGMLGSFETQGYLLRDLDKGVVHFPARRGNQDVMLCWTEGEREIKHWHPVDGGRCPEDRDRHVIRSEDFRG